MTDRQYRTAGVTAIAVVFLLTAGYLLIVGLLMLARPRAVSMAAGAPLLGGFELAGPYAFLLIAAVGVLIGMGLLRRNNWARRLAIVAAAIGIVLLLPTVSSAVVDFRIGNLAWGGFGIMVRVIIVWYLSQPDARTEFLHD